MLLSANDQGERVTVANKKEKLLSVYLEFVSAVVEQPVYLVKDAAIGPGAL